MSKFLNPRQQTPFGLEEVICDTWPAPHLIARPGDALGAAIVAYAAKWRDHPDFPEAPWDPRRGEVHLRDLDGAPDTSEDEPPRYRVKAFSGVNGTLYNANSEIEYHHWLNRNNSRLMSNLEPLNESARRIWEYTDKFVGGRQMTGQPYSLG